MTTEPEGAMPYADLLALVIALQDDVRLLQGQEAAMQKRLAGVALEPPSH